VRRLELPEDWEHVPRLRRRMEELLEGLRHRTALDEVLRHLRRDPESIEALYFAITILGMMSGRAARLESPEPVTERQTSNALLAPIMTECNACSSTWCSSHTFMHHSGVRVFRVVNPVGLQCQDCRYTLCRDCLGRRRPESYAYDVPVDLPEIAGGPCPAAGCDGAMGTPVFPTGRHDVTPLEPDEVEGVVVACDGVIPPTMDEALAVVTRFVPFIDDDAPLVHIGRSVPGLMIDPSTRDELALSLVHDLERGGSLAPGAWERSVRRFILAGAADDPDYLITVVRKPELTRTPDWLADLTSEHLRHMSGQIPPVQLGACWADLGRDDVITATAQLMDQGISAAIHTTDPVVRHCAVAGYVIAVTVLLTFDVGSAHECLQEGYLTHLEGLLAELHRPADDGPEVRDSFVHWIVSTDGATVKLDATVLPADGRHETALFATDLMTPAERRRLGN
jgi:hypothetical protein